MRASTLFAGLVAVVLASLCGLLFLSGSDLRDQIDPRAYHRATAGTHWESGSAVCPGTYQVPMDLFLCLSEHERRTLDKCPRLEQAHFGVDRLGRATVALEGSTPRCSGESAGRFGVGMTLIGSR